MNKNILKFQFSQLTVFDECHGKVAENCVLTSILVIRQNV